MMKIFLSVLRPLPQRRGLFNMVQQFNFGAKKGGKDTLSGSDTESKKTAKSKKTGKTTGSDSDKKNASDSEGRKAIPLDQSFFNFANKQNTASNQTKQSNSNTTQSKQTSANSSQNNLNQTNKPSQNEPNKHKESTTKIFEPIAPRKPSHPASNTFANNNSKKTEDKKPTPSKEAPQKKVDTSNVISPEKPTLTQNEKSSDKPQTSSKVQSTVNTSKEAPQNEVDTTNVLTPEKPTLNQNEKSSDAPKTSDNNQSTVYTSKEAPQKEVDTTNVLTPEKPTLNHNEGGVDKTQTYPKGESPVNSQSSTSNLNNSGSSSSSSEGKNNDVNVQEDLLGNIKVIETVQGHRVPLNEDTIGGRYASTLFIVSSQEKALFKVYKDMKFLNSLYERMESFRIFSDNSGLNANQINSFIQEISSIGEFCETTIKFCDLVAKNKRFMFINEISKKYIKLYLLLTKEEKITILSAYPLSKDQKNDVQNALLANKENEGKTFIIDYEVNPNLIGGLQMYTENKFMDLSLSSRIDRIKEEINKMI